MRTQLDCIPCMLRQALDAARRVTDNHDVHEEIVRRTLTLVANAELLHSPPRVAEQIYRLISEITGEDDPFRELKSHWNSFMLDLYPQLEERVQQAPSPFDTAIRMAIAGNIIDFGAHGEHQQADILETIDHALEAELDDELLTSFKNAIDQAESILYLGDNAGEIVLDKLFLEQLPIDKITFAVRGRPIINDCTMVDVKQVGLDRLLPVIDNGTGVPGTVLECCSDQFRQVFDAADLVISKGQGNFETLNDCAKDIFFLLKVKCPIVSTQLGRELGSVILHRTCHSLN